MSEHDPFADVREGQERTKHLRGGTYPNSHLRGLDRPERRPGFCRLAIGIDPRLNDWLEERAALLGVNVTWLVRDVLTLWRRLVIEAEAERGDDYGTDTTPIPIVDRPAGYESQLYPRGSEISHMDSRPMGLEEL